ncbi:MAG: GAF domain-containing protein, partial [Myxococcota bacterium]
MEGAGMIVEDGPSSTRRAYRTALETAVGRYEELIRGISVLREIDAIDDVEVPLGLLCRRLVQVVSAATSYLEDDVSSAEGETALARKFQLGKGVAGLVVMRGNPLRISDVRSAPEFVAVPETRVPVRSLLCLPLGVDSHIIGVFNLSHSRPGFFTEQDEATMTLVAERCARLLASHRMLHRHRVLERCYQLACDQAGDGIVVIEEDGSIVMTNRVAETILGVDLHDAARGAERWLERIEERDREMLLEARAALWSAGKACTTQYRMAAEPGEVRIIEEHATLVTSESDVERQAVCVLRDVSRRVREEAERTALESQLRHAQKMEALGELAGGITHDFNNTLTGILANVSLARESVDASILAELLADIEAAANQGASMTRRLLAMSRRSEVERESIDVGRLIDDVIAILRNTVDRRVGLHRHVQPGLWQALADRSQI